MTSFLFAFNSYAARLNNKNAIQITRVAINIFERKHNTYIRASDEVLFTVGALGDQEARRERMLREIMQVDKFKTREEALPKFKMIEDSNRRSLGLAMLPYRIGLFASITGAIMCVPMIFQFDCVMYFNHHFVTADIPEPKDLETWLEVGSFAWNWMEPVLGTISFILLSLQFARNQLRNIGARPYTSWYKHRRSERLTKEFPQYDKFILKAFSEGDPLSV